MAEGGDTFPDTELQRLARGVCLIEIINSSGKADYKGTGFHYGRGWVMSVAHNFQDETKDDATTHSLICKAKFTFVIEGDAEVDVSDSTCVKKLEIPPKDKKEANQDKRQNSYDHAEKQKEKQTYVVFEPRERVAFISHLRTFKPMPDGSRPVTTKDEEDDGWVDWTNKDIAMIKLGHQSEWGRCDQEACFAEWENEEEKIVSSRIKTKNGDKLLLAPFCEVQPPEPKEDQTVFGFHFGGDDDNVKIIKSTITEMIDGTTYRDGSVKNVPMLRIDKPAGLFPEGASGCPILIKDVEGQYRMVGLHFAGGDDDEAGNAEALRWNKGIQDHIGNESGVPILMFIGRYTYIGHRQECSKCPPRDHHGIENSGNELTKLATENNLTIYLSNGEIFKGNYQGRK